MTTVARATRCRVILHATLVACVLLGPAPLRAAAPDAAAPDAAAFANDPVLFLRSAETHLHWHEPTEPTKIVGPIYFVGTKGLASYLITTRDGHVLLNTGMPGSGPMIADAIRKLGFKPEDVRILLAGHAHVDHVGGHAYMQQLSGGRVAMMGEELALFQSGGKTDFHYGAYPEFAFEPSTVAQILRDRDAITLGGVTITARLTPGHTQGATTFVTRIRDGKRRYTVVFPNGTSINPGYRLVKDPSYPTIAEDYRRTFRVLESLQPDIWLDAHTDVFDFEGKRARAAHDGPSAWVDRDGYRQWLGAARAKFDGLVTAEEQAPPVPSPSPTRRGWW